MKINKVNITNYLEMNNIDVSDMKWNEMLAKYKEIEKSKEKTITKDEIIEVVDKSVADIFEEETSNDDVIIERVYDEDDIRNGLIKDIIELMETLKGKMRGTPEQIKIMFSLYNNFYKRNESPGCSQCVGNVYQKLLNIYKKYN